MDQDGCQVTLQTRNIAESKSGAEQSLQVEVERPKLWEWEQWWGREIVVYPETAESRMRVIYQGIYSPFPLENQELCYSSKEELLF